MGEFFAENWIIALVIAFVVEVLLGMLTQSIATGKGYGTNWFLAGFLLSIVGVLWVVGLPDKLLRDKLTRLQGPDRLPAGAGGMTPQAGVDESELAAVGQAEDKRFVMRSFRPVGESATAWARAGRG